VRPNPPSQGFDSFESVNWKLRAIMERVLCEYLAPRMIETLTHRALNDWFAGGWHALAKLMFGSWRIQLRMEDGLEAGEWSFFWG
jgi:hypothetical protein